MKPTHHSLSDSLIEQLHEIVARAREKGHTEDEVVEEVRYQFDGQKAAEDMPILHPEGA